VAQGESERVRQFVGALREGPGGSFVSEVEESVEPLIEAEEGFVVVA
jgi:acylphosphatase